MDFYTISRVGCQVPVNALICDSNLLVALFSFSRRELRDEAQYLVELDDFKFVVPTSVIVEAFHFCKDDAKPLLDWVSDYTKVELLPEDNSFVEEARDWHYRTPILDLVDCLLIVYARRVALSIGRTKPLPIVTSDQRMINVARGFDNNLSFLDLNDPTAGVV